MIHQYERTAHYYETDRMGIIHHSNYIRWFEEARVAFLEAIGLPYDVMEEAGVLSPVLSVNCQYKAMVGFNDRVIVHTWMEAYNGIKFKMRYEVKSLIGEVVYTTGESDHCFVNKEKKLIILKKAKPDMHKKFLACLEAKSETK